MWFAQTWRQIHQDTGDPHPLVYKNVKQNQNGLVPVESSQVSPPPLSFHLFRLLNNSPTHQITHKKNRKQEW